MIAPNELRNLSGAGVGLSLVEESAYGVLADLLDATRAREDKTISYLSLYLSESTVAAVDTILKDAGYRTKANTEARTITIYG